MDIKVPGAMAGLAKLAPFSTPSRARMATGDGLPVWATNTHAAPALSSPYPPASAVLPSPDSATEQPWSAFPAAPAPASLPPCWVHTPPERVNTQVAPAPPLSPDPPTMAVLPSAESATEEPCVAFPTAPAPASLPPCWVHAPPERVYTHVAPACLLSCDPPTRAVLPSADSATEAPWVAFPTAPLPTSLSPCWVHTPPERVNTQAAPAPPLSPGPPTTAVLPSADRATDCPACAPLPKSALTASEASSAPPCWVHTPPERVKTQAAPMNPTGGVWGSNQIGFA